MTRNDTPAHFVFDFDSTIVQGESLEELAAISLRRHPESAATLREIASLTERTMRGAIPYQEALIRRIELLGATRDHIGTLIKRLKQRISKSILRNRSFFRDNRERILIVSGGFDEVIVPVVKRLGLTAHNVHANSLTYDRKGRITGVDTKNVLSRDNGKADLIRSLKLKRPVVLIGDGITDYQAREQGAVDLFYAFTENVRRESVVEVADQEIASFDEFLYLHKLPMVISYPKSRIKVLLLENIHRDAVRALREEGYTVETASGGLGEAGLTEKIRDVSILGVRSKTAIARSALQHAQSLMAVGVFGIGTNHIDLDACAEHGVIVFNAPYGNTRSVVELVIGNIIMLMRKAADRSAELHRGIWRKSATGCYELRGKKLGIVGYGNIGSQLSVLAEALGMDVYYHDIAERLRLGNATKCVTLRELLELVDVVTVHVDGRPENEGLFGATEFSAMKEGALFLNLSRVMVVDVEALAECITSGHIAGAALDVFPQEPKKDGAGFSSPVLGLPNVILTPHIGGSTLEAQQNIGRFVAEALISFVNTGDSSTSINFPQVQLPVLRNAHRLIHVHLNKPGVLSDINGLFVKYNINILGQYLKTTERIGYVITDVSKKYNKSLLGELKKVSHTIKFRVLY
jgi:D-3-phosphoglycerate dehydrogenase